LSEISMLVTFQFNDRPGGVKIRLRGGTGLVCKICSLNEMTGIWEFFLGV
jgi:hypothetical protein